MFEYAWTEVAERTWDIQWEIPEERVEYGSGLARLGSSHLWEVNWSGGDSEVTG